VTLRWTALVVALLAPGCAGSTGGDAFELEAVASGPGASAPGGTYEFRSGRGFEVVLEEARLHVGAVYLSRAVGIGVSRDVGCQLPGNYVAELPGPVDVDLLAAADTAFTVTGSATEGEARTGEVWLTGGDVSAPVDPTEILSVRGVARRDGAAFPFEGSVTISTNRAKAPPDPALPGSEPACKLRIASPIPTDLLLAPGRRLRLRVDPAAFFANVDFTALPAGAPGEALRFADDDSDPASANLYGGLVRTQAYTFESFR